MKIPAISAELKKQIANVKLPQGPLSFGHLMAPIMAVCHYNNGKWHEMEYLPYGSLPLEPSCKTLHYAQEIFEGLKAYKTASGKVQLFRPEQNARRLNSSAVRMAMPEIPEELFLESVITVSSYCKNIIPEQSGSSLYLRPFMFGTDTYLGVKPSESYVYCVIASPSGSYFANDKVNVLIEREQSRACPGGTGAVKTGGNYAASLLSGKKASKLGYQQTLWLDAVNKKSIEEMSGMNFMAVVDNQIQTPSLSGSILPGITRDSILKLAPKLGYSICEKKMDIDELIGHIKSKRCTETFACGTAAIINTLHVLGEVDGTHYQLPDQEGKLGKHLRQELLDIQEGRRPDPFGNWIVDVPLQEFV